MQTTRTPPPLNVEHQHSPHIQPCNIDTRNRICGLIRAARLIPPKTQETSRSAHGTIYQLCVLLLLLSRGTDRACRSVASNLATASTMGETVEFSLPLPRALDTRIHAHLTLRDRSITLFLTTAAADDQSVPPSMGSFVYAIPDVRPQSRCTYLQRPQPRDKSVRLTSPEIQPGPSHIHPAVHPREQPRVCHPHSEASGQENPAPRLRRELAGPIQYGNGRDGRGGDGGFQDGRRSNPR